jgi:hypothetical protein
MRLEFQLKADAAAILIEEGSRSGANRQERHAL